MINKFIKKIKFEYGNDAYVGISGDRFLDEVPPKLRMLWQSPDVMSISNLDIYHSRTFDKAYPDYTFEMFEKEAIKLHDDLAHEFVLIINNSKERRPKI